LITHLFLVIVCLTIFFVFYPADAIPWTSDEKKALDADAIAVGRIVSYHDDGAQRYYEISIIKWIKNPQLSQTITMRSITPKVFDQHVPYEIFEKKDLGLFYIKLIDGEWHSTNYSKQIFASEQSQTIYNMKKLVGNNDPDSSVSLERICKEGHVNAVKNRTGEIYCVKRESLEKLRERGWAEPLGDVVFQRTNPIKSESKTKSIITVQDRPINRTIVPITITEMTTDAQSLDTITHWDFSISGIDMATLNKYWGNLANQYITSEMVDQNGDDVLDYSRIPDGMIFYKLSLFYYPTTCDDGTKITGEGGYPEPIPIKKGTDTVFFKRGDIGLYPDDNGKYFFDFVSGFETDVEFHPNIHVISQETKKCKLDTNQRNFTDVYYTNAVFDFKELK